VGCYFRHGSVFQSRKEANVFKEKGKDHSYALIPICADPPPNVTHAESHAIAFAGEVYFSKETSREIKRMKDQSDDADNHLDWDLDFEVGPSWRSVKAVAPLVAVTNVHSFGADEDDTFQFGVKFRNPAWSPQVGDPRRIILHVTVEQAGARLQILRLSYSATATGSLINPEQFVS
jgi:hypothetical protein